MGWNGGTEIFDTMVAELSDLSHCWVNEDYHKEFMEPLEALVWELDKQDWDNHCESVYWDHCVIGRILGNTFEEDE